jgi:hypothetical protein
MCIIRFTKCIIHVLYVLYILYSPHFIKHSYNTRSCINCTHGHVLYAVLYIRIIQTFYTHSSIHQTHLGGEKRVSFCTACNNNGWSELAPTNAPVEDEPVQPILRMNILLARCVFFFHLFSAPPTSPLLSPLLPPQSYLPPTSPLLP